MRWVDGYPGLSMSDDACGHRATSLELEILDASLRSGARLIARQEEIIGHLRSRNCPTVASEGFLRVLKERQAARLEKWRAIAPLGKELHDTERQ